MATAGLSWCKLASPPAAARLVRPWLPFPLRLSAVAAAATITEAAGVVFMLPLAFVARHAQIRIARLRTDAHDDLTRERDAALLTPGR